MEGSEIFNGEGEIRRWNSAEGNVCVKEVGKEADDVNTFCWPISKRDHRLRGECFGERRGIGCAWPSGGFSCSGSVQLQVQWLCEFFDLDSDEGGCLSLVSVVSIPVVASLILPGVMRICGRKVLSSVMWVFRFVASFRLSQHVLP